MLNGFFGSKPRSFCCFWNSTQVLYFRLLFFFYYEGYSISSKGFLPNSSKYDGHLYQIHPLPSTLVHWFLNCQCSLLLHLLKHIKFPLIHGPNLNHIPKAEELMLLNCGVGEDSWESLGLQGDPVDPKGNQSWIFIRKTDAEAAVPVLWPPNAKSWLIREEPDAGKDWRQQKKGQQRMRWLDNITNSMDMNSG